MASLDLLRPGRSDVLPAGYRQDVAVVRVRNNQVYQSEPLFELPVAVCESSPFRVEVVPPAVPLVRGSPLTLKVKVHRDGKMRLLQADKAEARELKPRRLRRRAR